MGKYKILKGQIKQDGKRFQNGDEIELDDEQAGKFPVNMLELVQEEQKKQQKQQKSE